jgi:hypothetical protein
LIIVTEVQGLPKHFLAGSRKRFKTIWRKKKRKKTKQLAKEHNQWLQSVNARFLCEKNGNKPWLPTYKISKQE